ncbi:MAG TPA: hypothetical protein ENK57_07045 [Polyangiaceae bacterium]|nr:hypothetical protein [Polyangiaceae bacterium]
MRGPLPWGVDGLLGAFFPGAVWQFGPEGPLGYQIGDLMAVYASFGAHAGFRVEQDESGDSSFNAGAGESVGASVESDRRKQFTLALDLSVVFGDRYEVTSSGNVDAGIAVGVLPMLAIGYDAK